MCLRRYYRFIEPTYVCPSAFVTLLYHRRSVFFLFSNPILRFCQASVLVLQLGGWGFSQESFSYSRHRGLLLHHTYWKTLQSLSALLPFLGLHICWFKLTETPRMLGDFFVFLPFCHMLGTDGDFSKWPWLNTGGISHCGLITVWVTQIVSVLLICLVSSCAHTHNYSS